MKKIQKLVPLGLSMIVEEETLRKSRALLSFSESAQSYYSEVEVEVEVPCIEAETEQQVALEAEADLEQPSVITEWEYYEESEN